MKVVRIAPVLLTLFIATSSLAADPADPVKTLMVVAGWTGEGAPKVEAQDYFDETLLASIYSASFVEVYRIAQQVDELSDGQGYMTGYDVVIGGQDSCPLKDVRIETRPAVGVFTPVAVYLDAVSVARAATLIFVVVSAAHRGSPASDGHEPHRYQQRYPQRSCAVHCRPLEQSTCHSPPAHSPRICWDGDRLSGTG